MQDDPLESPNPQHGTALPGASAAASLPAAKKSPAEPEPDAITESPAWAEDLRELYNAVVEEPLPDSFMDLLSKLDAED